MGRTFECRTRCDLLRDRGDCYLERHRNGNSPDCRRPIAVTRCCGGDTSGSQERLWEPRLHTDLHRLWYCMPG